MTYATRHQRRGTILLMVVGLLAMLFIIVSAFITLARFDRITQVQADKRQRVDNIVDSVKKNVLGAMVDQLADGEGRILYGGLGNDEYIAESIPGFRSSRFLGSFGTVRQAPLPLNVPLSVFDATDFRFAGMSQFNPVIDNMPLGFGAPGRRALDRTLEFVRYPQGAGAARSTPSIVVDRNMAVNPSLRFAQTNTGPVNFIDLVDIAQSPFMDADGDGIPDTYLPAMASLIEQANAELGVSVRVPPSIDFIAPNFPALIDDPVRRLNIELFREYERNAKVDVAVRVIDHGAMVYPDPDSFFGRVMYNWVRSRQSRGPGAPADPELTRNDALSNSPIAATLRAALAVPETIEPLLRRRFGLPTYEPATAAEQDQAATASALPQLVRSLEELLPSSFRPRGGRFSGNGAGHQQWQRFNIGEVGSYDLRSWQLGQGPPGAAWVDTKNQIGVFPQNPTADAMLQAAGTLGQSLQYYSRRAAITTVSNSDELSRVIEPQDFPEQAFGQPVPVTRPAHVDAADTRWMTKLGLPHGAPKFFLGEVEKAFFNTPSNPGLHHQFRNDAATEILLQRLASYYYDMIGGHDWTGADEVVNRTQQAYMLAVNTVAFAAPRIPSGRLAGFIDTVVYIEPNTLTEYVGYGPQPFITEVIAVREGDDVTETDNISVAVELYNPHDQRVLGTVDAHALNLDQFRLSINNEYNPIAPDPTYLIPLADPTGLDYSSPTSPRRMNGRTYHTVGIPTSPSPTGAGGWAAQPTFSYFYDQNINPLPTLTGEIRGLPLPSGGSNNARYITVKLWRRNAAGTKWYQVDELKVVEPENMIFDNGSNQFQPDDHIFSVAARDTASEDYFGPIPVGYLPSTTITGTPSFRPAWRCVLAMEPGDRNDPGYFQGPPQNRGDGDPNYGPTYHGEPLLNQTFGGAGITAAVSGTRAPTTPMDLMNPNLTLSTAQPVNGVIRPNAFPTVGFLMYLPRYSHYAPQGGDHIPMGLRMREEFEQKNYTGTNYPVDFGHMPFFDNKQDTVSVTTALAAGNNTAPFDPQRNGALPWGLLAWDYFSTRNVSEPVVTNFPGFQFPYEDPQKISGRINVNTAPWYVLAGVPMITTGSLAIQPMPAATSLSNASPAFYSLDSGTLFGVHQVKLLGQPWNTQPTTRRFDDMGRLVIDPAVGEAIPGNRGIARLGGELAQAICAYRDRVPHAPQPGDAGGSTLRGIAFAHLRDQTANPRTVGAVQHPETGAALPNSLRIPELHIDLYAQPAVPVTGFKQTTRAGDFAEGRGSIYNDTRQYGFMSLGELLMAYGMASDRDERSMGLASGESYNGTAPTSWPLTPGQADYYKAVAYMALLDTHYLTTRSNTFTAYASIMNRDPDVQEQSVRLQMTADRSNILPQMVVGPDFDGNGFADIMTKQRKGLPEIIAERRVGYFNTRNDN